MNCRNCGAPLRPVAGKDYFVCDYCTAFHFPPESEEGVRVLGAWTDMSCPVCRDLLVSAAVDGIPVRHCTKCRGNLFKPLDFRRIVEGRRLKSEKLSQLRPLDQTQLARQILCPGCLQPMDVHPYYGPGNAVIDSCGTCALIWLDQGELKAIVTAPERRRRR
jgi:Zn-finger nucleic acid-binding protein